LHSSHEYQFLPPTQSRAAANTPTATAANPFPRYAAFVGPAACEVELVGALEDEADPPVAVPVGAVTDDDELGLPMVALAGSIVPHLFLMLVVQLPCPIGLPACAALHSLQASMQMNYIKPVSNVKPLRLN
jgi:hypothetical protein